MADFRKRLSGQSNPKAVDPVRLYETLDRAHDKGPLRPAQEAVLVEWYRVAAAQRDVVVKLHTGQGKTLVGLLALQSRLNSGDGPAVYLCPNNYLVAQTRHQAKQFGISTCDAPSELPGEFLDCRAILVTSVHKLFNGLTKFGLGRESVAIGALLMDDAHACSDRIRQACGIRLNAEDEAYRRILELFRRDIEYQGAGTFADIVNKSHEAILPVPYWAWREHTSSVASILSSGRERNSIKFAWPLLKDMLPECQCAISGGAIEIEPYVPPLHQFRSYHNASHRLFMSATVTDDAFLVKGLQLDPTTIAHPLTYSKERWSGERMVLLPSLIHDKLNQMELVARLAKPSAKRGYGVVALVSSFRNAESWKKYGAKITDKDTVHGAVQALQNGEYNNTVVLVNQYDGIDLPDDACRVLVFDGRPYSENLIDLYQESCRPSSGATLIKTLRTVEQGMGRSVRGAKDYSVVVMLGASLVRLVRDKKSRTLVSAQMRCQIELGLEIAKMAEEDIREGAEPLDALLAIIMQCLNRDEGWKLFYGQEMEKVVPSGVSEPILRIYEAELKAEMKHLEGDLEGAVKSIQGLLDTGDFEDADRGWYLQEMARYTHSRDRQEAQRLQGMAHRKNRLVLRPAEGFSIQKLTVVSEGRMDRILDFLRECGSYEQVNLAVSEVVSQLVFGVHAEAFESALKSLGLMLGLGSERPDREWKEGPDNLWALDQTRYILFECKSEVDIERSDINKREAEQMNRSCAWFEKHYQGCTSRNVIIHPAHMVESAANFLHTVEAMRPRDLDGLVKKVRSFFGSLESSDLGDLSPKAVQKLVNLHNLDTGSLLTQYTKALRHRRREA